MKPENQDGWWAQPPADHHDQAEPWTVGTRIRVMCDGGGFPLWDDDGRLPEEPEFLAGFLGLSSGLVDDLRAWSDMVDANISLDTDQLNREGENLRIRLAQELGRDFTVEFVPEYGGGGHTI